MRLDYTMVRGDTRTFEMNLEFANGTVVDLGGASVAFIVDGLFSKAASDGITVDESSGEAVVTVLPADTEDAPDVRHAYPYNVQVTEQDGTVLTTQRGLFIVLPDVTA